MPDRAAQPEAPAIEDEIEVTPKMIAAGIDTASALTERSVAHIYRAMEFARISASRQKPGRK